MTVTEEKNPAGVSGDELVAQLQASGALDDLFAKIDAEQVSITGT